MQPQAAQPGFSARGVTSKEEALATQTDYFSAGTVMPDLAHDVVYLKRFNQMTGASDFLEFRRVYPEPPAPPAQYVTVDEFNAFKEEMKKVIGNE